MNTALDLGSFWHWLVILLTLASILGCLWLLLANGKAPGGADTGHVWDEDLRELNHPLPRWWAGLFILTLLFGAGYLLIYPGLGNYAGSSRWSSQAQMQQELARVQATRRQRYGELAALPVTALAQDPRARELGRELFMNHCAGCHGADARGAIGFPDLADRDWLYGGAPEAIVASITEGRAGQMPYFNAMLKPEVVADLVRTLRQWSDPALPPAVRERGARQFAATCAVCHGAEARGNPAMGAPDLTDAVWLHGSSYEQVRQSVLFGRKGNMPAHRELLTPEEIRVVAGYVYGLAQAP